MKRKISISLLLVLALAFTFTACEKIDPHQHAFYDVWTYDEECHWHAASCEHTDETSGKASHDMQVVEIDKTVAECKTCGYTRKVAHEHTYAAEYSSDEHGHSLPTTCGCLVANFSLHNFSDGVCDVCGWWSSASEVLFANLSHLDVWNYSLTFSNVNLNDVNWLSEGVEHVNPVVSGELKLSMSADGQIEGRGYFETDGLSVKVVVNANTVYACGTDVFFRCDLEEFLKQNGVDVQAYINELNADTQQIREYFDELNQIVSNLPVDGEIFDELFSSLLKKDETKSTAELSAYFFDTTLLRGLNQTFCETTVEQYVNAVLVELQGTPLGILLGDDFNGLPDKIYSLLKRTILQTMADLGAANFTSDDLIDQLNEIISAYYPDKNVNTVDDLLLSLGIDIAEIGKFLGFSGKNLTVKQLIDACSLASPEVLWNMFQQEDSCKINADEIKITLEQLCQSYGNKTVYDLIVSETEYAAEQLKEFIDCAADWLDENTPVVFYINSSGLLQQITIEANGQTAIFKRNGELEQDYSQVIDRVNGYYDSLESVANA